MLERSNPESVKENAMPETALTLARDMVAEVGRPAAAGYMAGRLFGAGSWPRVRQASRLLVAVLRA